MDMDRSTILLTPLAIRLLASAGNDTIESEADALKSV